MPLSFSNTGSTAFREAEVQQPKTAAHLSCSSSLAAFSAKVGQSLAPSSWTILILRPKTPPASLICEIANRSASTEPVSLKAIVPETECNWPTVTTSSVTARPVALTVAVAGLSAQYPGSDMAAKLAALAAPLKKNPCKNRRYFRLPILNCSFPRLTTGWCSYRERWDRGGLMRGSLGSPPQRKVRASVRRHAIAAACRNPLPFADAR